MLIEAGPELTFEALTYDEALFLYDEIFTRRLYERNGIRFACGPLTAPPPLVIDAGANIGLFALAVARQLGDRARVVAVEPVGPVFDVLRRNTADYASIVPVHAALGERCAPSVELSYYPDAPSESTRWAAEREQMQAVLAREAEAYGLAELIPDRPARALPVCAPLLTLSELLGAHGGVGGRSGDGTDGGGLGGGDPLSGRRAARVHLLKVDVEGDELNVLRGLSEAEWSRVDQAVVEVHDVPPESGAAESGAAESGAAAGAGAHDSVARPAPGPSTGDAAAYAGGRLDAVVRELRLRARFPTVHVERQVPQVTKPTWPHDGSAPAAAVAVVSAGGEAPAGAGERPDSGAAAPGDSDEDDGGLNYVAFVPEALCLFVVYAHRWPR